jgi:hypothetical protein
VQPHITQSLLDNPIEVQRSSGGQIARPTRLDVEHRGDAGTVSEARNQCSDRLYKTHTNLLIVAPKVVEHLANVVQNMTRRTLDCVHFMKDVIPADRLGLEVLNIDKHGRERLDHAIVELSGDHAPHLLDRYLVVAPTGRRVWRGHPRFPSH